MEEEDNNSHHQQQLRVATVRIAIVSTLMNFSKTWQAMMVMGMVMSRVICWGPKMLRFFENFANRMDQDDVLFGNLKWLENFKEIK